MSIDLHLHSLYSDGTNSPETLVELAKRAGLKTIALTDHDNIDGVSAAQKKGAEIGLEVIAGIEFTTETPMGEIHILGYFLDCQDSQLLSVLQRIKQSRIERIYKTVDKLKQFGVDILAEQVLALSGNRAPGRPHIARVMVKQGIVSSFKEAFNRYLDFHSPAYVPHYKLSPEAAISLVVSTGGIAVFAHPVVSNCDEAFPSLIAAGLRGVEAYYTNYQTEQINHYLELARKYGLLVTGGSDYHGEGSGREIKLGELAVPDELVEKLKDEHLRRNRS